MPSDPEEARGFLQQRLARLGGWGFVLGAPFLLAGALAANRLAWGASIQSVPNQLRAAALAVLGAIWLFCRRGRRPSGALDAIDTAGTLGASLCLGLVPFWAGTSGGRAALESALPILVLLVMRAIVVPSSASRSTWLGLASAAGPVVATALGGGDDASAPWRVADLFALTGFSLLGVLAATLASRAIYGQRRGAEQEVQLGQYTLEQKIGEGGMGAVYRATHAMLRRPTAIKLLPPEKMGSRSLRRFEREVQLTSVLTHPNTIAIYDYGRTPDGVFYYAMEYLDGITLETLVRLAGPLPAERVVYILEQVCGALAEAHSVGLIHRDIKPGNIILCERGGCADVVKVLDFGLVKDLGEGGGSSVAVVVGTPAYMSPEAISTPRSVDARSDLYSLGGVAYFLLTGSDVFEGSTTVELCGHHLHSVPVPPSRRLGRPLPGALELIVLSCLEKDPSRRPATARALGDALADCVPTRWTNADAERWWLEHRAKEQVAKPPTPPGGGSPQTLTVDLRRRDPVRD